MKYFLSHYLPLHFFHAARFVKLYASTIPGTPLTISQILTPTTLRTLIEGHPTISLSGLRGATRYEEGYHASHPTITTFWRVVDSWPQPRLRQLLEFVTASDRVPVNGERSLVFCIVRNGGDSEMLPTAMTCFGKLLLPEYEDDGKLERKLGVAVENCRGFGSA